MKRRAFQTSAAGSLGEAVADGLGCALDEARTLVARGAVYVRGRRQREPTLVVPAGQPGAGGPRGARPAVHGTGASASPAARAVRGPGSPGAGQAARPSAQPTPGGTRSLLLLASAHLGREAGLVHRLDRDTSGVTVFGATASATSALAASFRSGRCASSTSRSRGPGSLRPAAAPSASRVTAPVRAAGWRARATGWRPRRASGGSAEPSPSRSRRSGRGPAARTRSAPTSPRSGHPSPGTGSTAGRRSWRANRCGARSSTPTCSSCRTRAPARRCGWWPRFRRTSPRFFDALDVVPPEDVGGAAHCTWTPQPQDHEVAGPGEPVPPPHVEARRCRTRIPARW